MPQLSIVIPALDSTELMETTLVSVLQNRPADCEVVVLLDRPYADPYALAEEVRFTVVPAATTAGAVRAALDVCRGDVVHMLAAGAEVDEGWTDAALEQFCDPRIAAVAPLVIRSREEAVVCSTGVAYGAGGVRRRLACGTPLEAFRPAGGDVLGPTLTAAFYRREALRTAAAPFDDAVTDRLVDVDLALQLRAAGYRAVFEPRSLVYRAAARSPIVEPFAAGRGAERLFWRNAPTIGLLRGLAAHPAAVVGELFAAGSVGDKLRRLAGRAAAALEVVAYRRHHQAVAAVGKPGLSLAVTSTGDRIRFDRPHPHSAAGGKSPAKVDRRRDGDATV